MNNKILKILFCIAIISCDTISQKPTNFKVDKESFIYQFKITYFKKFLKAGFNNSQEINKVLEEDRSMGFSEPILSLKDLKLIDSFVTVGNNVLVQDSINKIDKVAEGAQGKHVFSYVLSKFNSKWLDSLSATRYDLYFKN